MSVSPIPTVTDVGARVTVYFSIEEGWIQILTFNGSVDQAIIPCRSEVMKYSELQMRYLHARQEKDPSNIYIFQAKRYQP